MATEKPLVNILEDIENAQAHAPNLVKEGDNIQNIAKNTLKNALMALCFKDANNNLKLPLVNEEGAQVVSFDAGTAVTGTSGVVTPADKDIRTMIAETPLLAPSKTFDDIQAEVHCTRLTLWELVLVEDIGGADTETPVAFAYTDQGNINWEMGRKRPQFSTDANADDKRFRIYATNLDKVSDCYVSSFSANQLADA